MKNITSLGFLLFAVGVGLGAFGAHGLRDYFNGREEEIWKTAVFYQLVHAIGLLILVSLEKLQIISSKIACLCSRAILTGTFIFSGSLYLLVLTRERWLGAITPVGGVLLIGSWLILTLSSFYSGKKEER